jgi:adenosine 3'-phospho 5'-phosphosulfate transporter B2
LASQLGLYIILSIVCYFLIRLVRSRPPSTDDHSLYARTIRCLVLGYESETPTVKVVKPQTEGDGNTNSERTPAMTALLLVYCSMGLLIAYLMWGIFQEKIMSTEYRTGRFESSNFLVFSNRMFALMVAVPMMWYKGEDLGRAPFYKYALTSLSNTLSSWCQLEALKYVSFPLQVLAKSSKMVPVMIMGRILSGKRYPWYEYGVAVVVGAGVTSFVLSQEDGKEDDKVTQFSGILLMLGYLMSDSFTSQWQDVLFKEYKLSSYQMMFGVNAFSSIFTLMSLLSTGEIISSLVFLSKNPEAVWHICAFSTAGAVGQTFIFLTIKEFGPLVFTIVSTVRQLLAIILSVIIFGHVIAPQGMAGAVLVFMAILYRVWKKEQETKLKKEMTKRAKDSGTAEDEEMRLVQKTDGAKDGAVQNGEPQLVKAKEGGENPAS